MIYIVKIEHTYESIYIGEPDYTAIIDHEVEATSSIEAKEHYKYDERTKFKGLFLKL